MKKKIGKMLLAAAAATTIVGSLCGFADANTIEQYVASMALEQKVAQLFIVVPEALTGGDTVTEAGDTMMNAIAQYPVGGVIFFEGNLQYESQVQSMISNMQSASQSTVGVPMFMCVDEEGGTVARVANTGNFEVPYLDNMSTVGATGDTTYAYNVGTTLGSYLSNLGFNLDFAPDADVLTNSENTVIGSRSFGSDPNTVALMSVSVLQGLNAYGVDGCVKHFPGHGATSGDTHDGYAYTDKTLAEMMSNEIIPFSTAIANGVNFVMVGHFSAPNVTGDQTPCSLSYTMITSVLRQQLGYQNIILTDALNMGAIVESYDSSTVGVAALVAGNDMILMPNDFQSAYQGVLSAVYNGQISEERINESVRRILRVKLN